MKTVLGFALCALVVPASAQQAAVATSGGGRSSMSLTVPIGRTVRFNNAQLTPVEVLEDSRCPRFVTCVWRGRIKVKFTVRGGQPIVLENDKPFAFGKGTLTLVGASPVSSRGEKVPPRSYRFQVRYDR